jgi:hypothetical protein
MTSEFLWKDEGKLYNPHLVLSVTIPKLYPGSQSQLFKEFLLKISQSHITKIFTCKVTRKFLSNWKILINMWPPNRPVRDDSPSSRIYMLLCCLFRAARNSRGRWQIIVETGLNVDRGEKIKETNIDAPVPYLPLQIVHESPRTVPFTAREKIQCITAHTPNNIIDTFELKFMWKIA